MRPDYVTEEMLEYLDELRESGETNMYGAGPYLIKDFSVNPEIARQVLMYWMETFGSDAR